MFSQKFYPLGSIDTEVIGHANESREKREYVVQYLPSFTMETVLLPNQVMWIF